MSLFEGYGEAYGTYTAGSSNEIKRGKVEIKSSAKTVRKQVTYELWQSHIEGDVPLGIIPIRDDDTCLWGCIDVDVYGVVHREIAEDLERRGLPMVVCRSKSGGAHLFLFMAEPITAEAMQVFLRKIAVMIGYGSSEVFPKQRNVLLDRGDLGSWLNMPYFEGRETNRYAIDKNGKTLSPLEFVEVAESLRQPAIFMDQDDSNFMGRPEGEGLRSPPEFSDAPPCMQYLSKVGFPEGTRNPGLFALGVFAKKKFGADWSNVLERWNRELMDPPLPSSEVVDIIRQHEKKDYYYRCKDQPLLAHCNSQVCRTRKFGVGGDDDLPVISGMSYLATDPPLWFVDVEDARVELSTEELQNYRHFHRICMEQLFKCFKMMKQDAWLQVVSDAMRNATSIEAPPEVGKQGQFFGLLEEFLVDRHRGESREDLLLGRPILESGNFYFRLNDLMLFLENSRFTSYSRTQVSTRIKRAGGGQHFFNIKGKGINVFFIPEKNTEPMPKTDIPQLEESPI